MMNATLDNSNGDHVSPLELEPAMEKFQVEEEPPTPAPKFNPLGTLYTMWLLILAYADYYRNVTMTIASLAIILAVILLLESVSTALNSQYRPPKISRDYSDVDSDFGLQLSQIDHWCLQGGDDDCICDDPSIGIPNEEVKGWTHAHHMNKKLVEAKKLENLDLVMLGDGAVEGWNGRLLGSNDKGYNGVSRFWSKRFTKEGGAKIDGIALGIDGDMISNLLWRINHGEVDVGFNSKVWWIVIGSNDLGKGECVDEVVLIGIMRLAKFVLTLRPGSTVVINSILPRPAPLKRNNHKHGIDLMPYISAVNEQLKAFCEKQPKIEYFDANPIFLNDPDSAHPTIEKHYYLADGIHVSTKGHKAWGAEIAKRVIKIIKEQKKNQPEDVEINPPDMSSQYDALAMNDEFFDEYDDDKYADYNDNFRF